MAGTSRTLERFADPKADAGLVPVSAPHASGTSQWIHVPSTASISSPTRTRTTS